MEFSLPSDCVARFRIIRKIAEGGYGTVHEAEQRSLGRTVAIKVLRAGALSDREALARFLSEAQQTATLSHPHIVRIYDHGAETGVPWIAYEFLPGGSVHDRVIEAPLPWTEALRLAAETCHALEEAHERGILHRDVKSSNVLLGEKGTAKLTDFGIARWGPGTTLAPAGSGVLGTPEYMAPELTQGTFTPLSDLYALGILTFEMLAGRLPFRGSTIDDVIALQRTAPVPRLAPSILGLPAAVDELLQRALAKEARHRFQSAREMYDALACLLPVRPTRIVAAVDPVREESTAKLRSGSSHKRIRAGGDRDPRIASGSLPRTSSDKAPRITRAWLGGIVIYLFGALSGAVMVSSVRWGTPASTPSSAAPGAAATERLATLTAREGELGRLRQMAGEDFPLIIESLTRDPDISRVEPILRRYRATCATVRDESETLLRPYFITGTRLESWPHRELLVLERVASHHAVSFCGVERSDVIRRHVEALKTTGFDDTVLGLRLDVANRLKYPRSVMPGLAFHRGLVVATATQLAMNPAAAAPECVQAFRSILDGGAMFGRAQVEMVSAQELAQLGHDDLKSPLSALPGELGECLARAIPNLWSIGVAGRVESSRSIILDTRAALLRIGVLAPQLAPGVEKLAAEVAARLTGGGEPAAAER